MEEMQQQEIVRLNARLLFNRTTRRLSKAELAAHLGVHARTYHRWEQGISSPSHSHLQALSAYFGVPPRRLGYPLRTCYRAIDTTNTTVLAQQTCRLDVLRVYGLAGAGLRLQWRPGENAWYWRGTTR